MGDQERTWILFGWVMSGLLFVFREVERRQRLQEAREEERRRYVDAELTVLNRLSLEAAAKAEGAAEASRIRREQSEDGWTPWSRRLAVVTVFVGVVGIVIIIPAYHLFGF